MPRPIEPTKAENKKSYSRIYSYFSTSITHRYFAFAKSYFVRKKSFILLSKNFTKKDILYNKSNYFCILIGFHQEPMNYDLSQDRRTGDVIIANNENGGNFS